MNRPDADKVCDEGIGHGSIFRDFPFHAWLIATYTWLLPYAANSNELAFNDVYRSGLTVFTLATILLLIGWAALRNWRASGIMTTLVFLCLVYYGHVYDSFFYGFVGNRFVIPVWLGIFVALAAITFRYRSRLGEATLIINISSLVLFLMPLGTLVASSSTQSHIDSGATFSTILGPGAESVSEADLAEMPDIYYLVFDRYASNQTLSDVYGFDNSPLIDRLRERGFFVNEMGRANYTKTAHSLASSLNMIHLTAYARQIGPNSSNWKPLYKLVRQNVVVRFLKTIGYHYMHLGSWWEPTRESPMADENFDVNSAWSQIGIKLNEFEHVLVEPMLSTRFWNFASSQLSGNESESRMRHFGRIKRKFEKLGDSDLNLKPRFIFAHMLIPHDPYVFFEDGRYKSLAEANASTRKQNYLDQLQYTNTKIVELVDQLLEREPQPVIIIQADEGPIPDRYWADEDIDWREATIAELKQKFGILNVIYVPDGNYESLYHGITPVNTFRVVFNKYFGLTLPLLPDVSYSHYSTSDLYTFLDVTESIR